VGCAHGCQNQAPCAAALRQGDAFGAGASGDTPADVAEARLGRWLHPAFLGLLQQPAPLGQPRPPVALGLSWQSTSFGLLRDRPAAGEGGGGIGDAEGRGSTGVVRGGSWGIAGEQGTLQAQLGWFTLDEEQ